MCPSPLHRELGLKREKEHNLSERQESSEIYIRRWTKPLLLPACQRLQVRSMRRSSLPTLRMIRSDEQAEVLWLLPAIERRPNRDFQLFKGQRALHCDSSKSASLSHALGGSEGGGRPWFAVWLAGCLLVVAVQL